MAPGEPVLSPTMVYLVVVDDTAEMRVALRYAARRTVHAQGRLVLLHVMEPTDRQHWLALEEVMREEKREEAERMMEALVDETRALAGVIPTTYIREGHPREEVLRLIDEDPTISVLVLAAGTGDAGPGPLVSALSIKDIKRLRIPLVIVPGSLTEAQIDALS